MDSQLKNEFQYYLDHQAEIAAEHDGKFVVIKGGTIIGSYDSEMAALLETKKHHELGTFLIQRVTSGPEGYTQTFHSRVVFS
jgi:hypothetical protein